MQTKVTVKTNVMDFGSQLTREMNVIVAGIPVLRQMNVAMEWSVLETKMKATIIVVSMELTGLSSMNKWSWR